jgi:hypothetical protein
MNLHSRSSITRATLFGLALSTNLTITSATPLQEMISPVTNPEIPAELRPFAERTIEAHLKKLRQVGAVIRHPSRYPTCLLPNLTSPVITYNHQSSAQDSSPLPRNSPPLPPKALHH